MATPPLHTRGRYTLKQPWVTDAATLWECIAIRSFDDIYKLSVDVFTQYYQPKGLTQTDVATDNKNRVNIITLRDDAGNVMYVPDSYILAYPSMDGVVYSHVVLSLSLGALPDYLDLSFLGTQISNICSDAVGHVPEVKIHKAASAGSVTPEQHEELEAARLASVKLLTTDYAKLKAAEATINELNQKVANYEQIMIAKGLVK